MLLNYEVEDGGNRTDRQTRQGHEESDIHRIRTPPSLLQNDDDAKSREDGV